MSDTTRRDRAITLVFALPVDARPEGTRWRWEDDVRRSRIITGNGEYSNTVSVQCGSTGTLSLYQGDEKVGEGQIHTQLGAFAIAGSGLYVGRHEGEPLSADLPQNGSNRFRGGTIEMVAIDVSGEPYVDMEREAALMLMRE